MNQFNSLGQFASYLLTRAVATAVALQTANEAIGAHVEKVAKGEFGTYQNAVGPFPAWAELAEATKDERLQQGFSENDPLFRSGELRDAVTHDASPLEAIIGVKSGTAHSSNGQGGSTEDIGNIMISHEFGTSKMPARPVLGPAVFQSKATIQKIVGAAVVSGLIGASPVHPALGYNFATKP